MPLAMAEMDIAISHGDTEDTTVDTNHASCISSLFHMPTPGSMEARSMEMCFEFPMEAHRRFAEMTVGRDE